MGIFTRPLLAVAIVTEAYIASTTAIEMTGKLIGLIQLKYASAIACPIMTTARIKPSLKRFWREAESSS